MAMDSKVTFKNSNPTLLGNDYNLDGVRDDLQAWIEKEYGSQTDLKLVARRYAQAYQNAFKTVDNKTESIKSIKSLLKASECFVETLKSQGISIEKSIQEKDKLKKLILNTKVRLKAQDQMNENFSGSSYMLTSKNEACAL